jgi:hypothetical protein
MKNGFKENLQWVSLISVTGIYGYYFAKVIPSAGPDVSAEDVVLFTIMLVLLVVIHMVGAIVLISLERFKEPILDERDKLINLKGGRNASWVLALGTFVGIACAFFIDGNFWVMHALLASMVLAQLLESATQIFLYRRGF